MRRQDNRHEDEAAQWAARRLSGRMSPQDEAAFLKWRAQATENARAMRDYDEALALCEPLGGDLLEDEFASQLEEEAAAARRDWRAPTAIAAGLVLALAIGGALFMTTPGEPAAAVYVTATGEQRQIDLEDGSRAALNTQSSMRISYTPEQRMVALEQGEAFFEVEPDTDRPFTVRTSHAAVEVTGTAFNIRVEPDNATVSVLSGSVAVAASGKSDAHVLRQGQALTIDAAGAGAISTFDARALLAWRQGRAIYAGEALSEVIVDLNRYFDTPIILADAELSEAPVTGEFDLSDQNTAAAALAAAFGLKARPTPLGMMLTRVDKSGEE